MSALVPIAPKPTAVEPVKKPLVHKPLNILNLNPPTDKVIDTNQLWKGRPVMRTKQEVHIVQVDSNL